MATTFSRLRESLSHRARMGDEPSLRARLVGLDHSIARRRCQRRYRLRQPYFQAPGRTESRPTIAHPHPRNPVGREIFGAARVIEGDVHALSMLPYHCEKVCGDGWAAVGDAAGFIDPR